MLGIFLERIWLTCSLANAIAMQDAKHVQAAFYPISKEQYFEQSHQVSHL